MTYKIFQNGTMLNRIVCDESFVNGFCEKNGYTYEEEIQPSVEYKKEPTTAQILDALLGVDI